MNTQVKVLLTILKAVENGIPSGHLYAALNAKGLNLEAYQSFLNLLKKHDAIEERGHYLTKGQDYDLAIERLTILENATGIKETV